MSVIVNMEMPQNCKDCMDSGLSVAVSVFGAMCPFCEKVFVPDFNINIEKQRLKNCPLIELPLHSDLVDRNKLLAEHDRQHKGPAGGARRIMERADAVIEGNEE